MLLIRPYLEGQRFSVPTDYNALRWLLNVNNATGRLARWRLRSTEFDFNVQYRSGINHLPTDALSHMPAGGNDETRLEDEIPCLFVDEDVSESEYVIADVTVNGEAYKDVLMSFLTIGDTEETLDVMLTVPEQPDVTLKTV